MTSPDPLSSAVVFLHQVLIVCIVIVLIFYFLQFIWLIAYPIGATDMNPFTNIQGLSISLYYFAWIVVKICEIIICILVVLLFWVFVFWLLIIIFVPFIIIFPIPIIPFFFIIPLKPLLLLLIPPFKVLTDIGTLPLLLKICTRLINPQIFTNTLNYLFYPTINDIGNYFKTHITNTINNIIGKDIENLFNTSEETFDNEQITNNELMNDDKEDVKKYNEFKEKPNIKSSMKTIEEETEMCIKLNQNFKPYNSSYIGDIITDIDNSFNPYNKCYTNAIKSYLKTSTT